MEFLSAVDWFALLCWTGAFILIALGFAGTIIPAIPGLPMIAGGAWLVGWADHYEKVGWKTITLLVGSLVGTVAGMFLGVFGLLFMPLIGAALGEFWAKRNLIHAGRVGVATWIGMIVGTAVKIALAFAMTGILVFVWLTA